MSKHKKQHYIPRCYLEAWCDPRCPPHQEPYVWMYEKESKNGKRKSPKNIFHETDLYTIQDEEGGRNLEIEHGLSELENHFATIRKEKINRHLKLDHIEELKLTTFIAALHVRTISQLAHMADQWRRPLEMMDEIAEKVKMATVEEKKNMANMSSLSGSDSRGRLTHEQVRQMVSDPVGTTLIPMIEAEASRLPKLDMAILCTDTAPGFITSDNPCVWADPMGYTRPPLYRQPALMYETIEITTPLSPTECILLNRQGLSGYINTPEEIVCEFNRRVRFHSSEYYVVNEEYVDDTWFAEYEEPKDSWNNKQKRD